MPRRCAAGFAIIPFVASIFVTTVPQIAGTRSAWAQTNARTVRLAPASFPALPAAVRQDLVSRGCRVPQPATLLVDSSKTYNVVPGAFYEKGKRDWAVLCSVRDSSRILVYRDGAAAPSDSLRKLGDAAFEQVIMTGRSGFSRLIGASGFAAIRRRHALLAAQVNTDALPADADHDGIEDAYVEKGSSIHYFHRTRWLILAGAD